jgi:hypothetical protein
MKKLYTYAALALFAAVSLAQLVQGAATPVVPIATTTRAGIVKPDGTSVTVAADGTMTAQGAGFAAYTGVGNGRVTHDEMDAAFANISSGVTSVNGESGIVTLDAADVDAVPTSTFTTYSTARAAQWATLGTAAFTASTAYATAAQGGKADTALQPGDVATTSVNGAMSAADKTKLDNFYVSGGVQMQLLDKDLRIVNGRDNAYSLDLTKTSDATHRGGGIAAVITVPTGGEAYPVINAKLKIDKSLTTGMPTGIQSIVQANDLAGGTPFAGWFATAGPPTNTSAEWRVVGAEINTIERYADSGYAESRTGHSTVALQLVPESNLTLSGLDAMVGYNGNFGLLVTKSGTVSASQGDYTKYHVPISVQQDGTAAGGTTVLLRGGSDATKDPNIAVKLMDYQNIGIDTSAATMASDAIRVGATQTFGDGTNSYTLAQLAETGAGGGGTVTAVSSANADIAVATGTTTPVLTLNSGTGANQIVKLDSNGYLPNARVAPSSTSSTTGFTVARSSADLATGARYTNLTASITSTINAPHASSALAGIESFTAWNPSSPTGPLPSLFGGFFTARNSGSGVVTNLDGIRTDVRNNTTTGGDVISLSSVYLQSPINGSGGDGAVITNSRGLHIENHGLSGTTFSAGVNIANQSGATASHSIYTGTSTSGASFGDFVNFRNVSAPSNIADSVRVYNVEGDYLHIKDEDGNDHTLGQNTLTLGTTGSLLLSGGNATTLTTTGATNVTLPTSGTLATVGGALGAATATSLLATGIVDGKTPITLTTGTSATLGAATYLSGYTVNNHATMGQAVTYTLPDAVAGLQQCVRNGTGRTGILTVTAGSGDTIDFDGAATAAAGNIASSGALGDAACFVAIDDTVWMAYVNKGTWAD